jgi:hypothetical protein
MRLEERVDELMVPGLLSRSPQMFNLDWVRKVFRLNDKRIVDMSPIFAPW